MIGCLLFFIVNNSLIAQHFKETILSSSTRMRAVKVIDFDQDGDLDIISSSPYGFLISENRAGKFYTRSLMPLMENMQPEILYFMNPNSGLGDFDGNGFLDFAFKDGSEIKIYFQTALYVFEPKIVYGNAENLKIEVHDFEGDGTADLILTAGNQMTWLASASDKTFSTYFERSGQYIGKQIFVDYDGDGNLDYVTCRNGTLTVGKIDPETRLLTNKPIYNYIFVNDFIIGDISGDGKADIIGFGNDMHIAIQGDNGWAERVYELDHSPDTGYFIDYNQDGVKDLITYDYSGLETFYHWSGNAIIKDFTADFNLVGQGDYFDFDSNGQKELFIYPSGNRLNPMNDFQEVEIMPTAPPYEFGKIVRFDIDKDKDKDILHIYKDKVYLLDNLGKNHFETSIYPDINIDGESCAWMVAADLDGDGDEDLITRIGNTHIMFSNEAGFSLVKKDTLDFWDQTSSQVKLFDINQDGLIDLLPQGRNEYSEGFVYYINKGNFTFEKVSIAEYPSFYTYHSEALDFDKDGDVDFIVKLSALVFLLENNGQGNYTKFLLASGFSSITSGLIVKDFDNDGFVDFTVLNHNQNATGSTDRRIQIMFNKGDNRTFTKIPVFSRGRKFGTIDINGDGLLDFIDLNTWGLTYHLADDFFQYRSSLLDIYNYWIGSYLVEDADEDGDIDVFVCSDKLILFENTNLTNAPFTEINLFLDENGNGIKESTELFYKDPAVAIVAGEEMFFGGKAKFLYPTFPFKFDIQHLDTAEWAYTTDFSTTLNLPENGTSETINIGIIPNKPIFEVGFDMNNNATRCNEVTPFYLNIRNEGNQAIPLNQYSLEIDSAISFTEFFPEVDSIVDSIAYNATNTLEPGEVFKSTILLNLPNELRTGDQFLNYGEVTAFDESNNLVLQKKDTLDFTLNCAYDPNDKMVKPSYGDDGYILSTQELKYTIRFQNTGNDIARNVRITDELSTNLDLKTLKMLSSSHPEFLSIRMEKATHKLIFDFIGINLPDSTTNLIGSQGFVSFSCLPSQRFVFAGKKIENTSSIYFDYNQPIITNTVKNTLTNCGALNKITWGRDYLDVNTKSRKIILKNPILDSVKWYKNDELFSTETNPTLDFDTPGDKLIKVVTYSPICVFEDSHTYFVIGTPTTTTTDFLNKTNLKIYPNPSIGNITLTGDNLTDYTLGIYDVHKSLIYKEKILTAHQTLNLPNSGIYFFTFIDKNGTHLPFVKRVIVLKNP